MADGALLACGCRGDCTGITERSNKCDEHRPTPEQEQCDHACLSDYMKDHPLVQVAICWTCKRGVNLDAMRRQVSTTVDASTDAKSIMASGDAKSKPRGRVRLDCGCEFQWSEDWQKRTWLVFGCTSHHDVARSCPEDQGVQTAKWKVVNAADPRGQWVFHKPPYKPHPEEFNVPAAIDKMFDVNPRSPSHYGGSWAIGDFITAQGLGFFEGNVIKYLCRWRKKDGLKDLKKALHYLQRFVDMAEAEEQGKEQTR